MAERAKRRAPVKPAAVSGEAPAATRRKRPSNSQAAQWQRQLLLPSEDERSAPFRAASASGRKSSKKAARSRRELQGAVASEVATDAQPSAVAAAEIELAVTVDPEPIAGVDTCDSEASIAAAADGGGASASHVDTCASEAPIAAAADGGVVVGVDADVGGAPAMSAADVGETHVADGGRDAFVDHAGASATPAADGGTAYAHDDDRLPSQSASPALADGGGDPAAAFPPNTSDWTPMQVVTHALAELEQRGGRAYDAISCDCARALLQRAQASSPRAAELLLARAGVHVQRLSERFERARERLQARIADAEQHLGALPDERAAVARGELVSAGRWLRRRAHLPVALARSPERAEPLDDYQSASNEWVAVSALARAVDVVPEQAGPYNPLRIASDLLERIRAVSPTYLNAQLSRLEQLASMLALPELPEPAAKPTPRKR